VIYIIYHKSSIVLSQVILLLHMYVSINLVTKIKTKKRNSTVICMVLMPVIQTPEDICLLSVNISEMQNTVYFGIFSLKPKIYYATNM